MAAEKAEADRLAKENARIEAEQREADRIAAEAAAEAQAERDRIAAAAAERERKAQEEKARQEAEDREQRDARAREILTPPSDLPPTLGAAASWVNQAPTFRSFNQPQFDVTPFLQAGANAPRRDIDIPETLYPWQNLTDEERAAGYTIPVYQPMAGAGGLQAQGDRFSRFDTAGTPVNRDGTPINPPGGTTTPGGTTPPGGTEAGQVPYCSDPNYELAFEGAEPYCLKKNPNLEGEERTAAQWKTPNTGNPGGPMAHGGPVNAGIGNLMSRERAYTYPDGTQMVEKVSQGRMPLGKR